MPQGSCSGANVFTCYCSSIDQIVQKDITLNGFADDHSLRKSFLASDRIQEQQAKLKMEHTFNNIKEWMDSMHLKLNSEKTEYIIINKLFSLRVNFLKDKKFSAEQDSNLHPWHSRPSALPLDHLHYFLFSSF